MAPVNVRLNPLGVIVFVVGLLISLLYLFGFPDVFRREPRVSMKELLSVSIGLAQRGGDRVREIQKAHNLHQKVKGQTKEGKDELLTSGDLESHRAIFYGFSKFFPGVKVISEEHETKPVDFNKIADVDHKLSEVDEVIESDQSIPASRVAIWIDPLDATQEYTEGLTEYVTVMVCVVVNGEPKIGVINRPFEGETVWAWDEHGHSKNLVRGTSPKQDQHKLIVSRSHQGDIQEVAKSAFNGNVEVIAAGGAGYKTLEVIKGSVNAYTHITLIKKWDICAGNAILNAVGGKMTTLDGDYINYAPESPVKNDRGLLATVSKKLHYEYLEKLATKAKEKMELKQAKGKSNHS